MNVFFFSAAQQSSFKVRHFQAGIDICLHSFPALICQRMADKIDSSDVIIESMLFFERQLQIGLKNLIKLCLLNRGVSIADKLATAYKHSYALTLQQQQRRTADNISMLAMTEDMRLLIAGIRDELQSVD